MMFGCPGADGALGGFSLYALVSSVLFWLLLAVGIVALIKYIQQEGRGEKRGGSVEILKERYARGEIDKKEFEERMKDIS